MIIFPAENFLWLVADWQNWFLGYLGEKSPFLHDPTPKARKIRYHFFGHDWKFRQGFGFLEIFGLNQSKIIIFARKKGVIIFFVENWH